MQTPAIDTKATFAGEPPRTASFTASTALPDAVPSWYCLPLQTLTNFELVEHQFDAQQIWFESAIALRPSNPRFQVDQSSLTLMAFHHKAGLKIKLGQDITTLDLGFISSEPLMISGLDAEGHCVSLIKTAELPASAQPGPGELSQRPVQGVTLDTHGTRILRIDSVAPFVVTRFWVQRAELPTVG